jgi:hypothetical protein
VRDNLRHVDCDNLNLSARRRGEAGAPDESGFTAR